jgi:hypothetical protein
MPQTTGMKIREQPAASTVGRCPFGQSPENQPIFLERGQHEISDSNERNISDLVRMRHKQRSRRIQTLGRPGKAVLQGK